MVSPPMARRVHRVLGVRILTVLAAAGCLGAACGSDSDRTVPSISEAIPHQIVEGMTLRQSQAGVLQWELRADSALHYGEGERTVLLGVHVDFYNEAGDSIRSELTARRGEMDPETHDLWAEDSVVVETRDGTRLETELLRWDQAIEKVVSDRFVRITRGKNIITGVGIESDAGLRSYRILSRVEGELQGEDEVADGD